MIILKRTKLYNPALKTFYYLYFIALFDGLYTKEILYNKIIIDSFLIIVNIRTINKRSRIFIISMSNVLDNEDLFINIPALKKINEKNNRSGIFYGGK